MRIDRITAGHGAGLVVRSLATDIADLAVVLDRTGARNVLGHSGGALVALRASLTLTIDKIAGYDPTVPITGCLPRTFIDPFEAAVRAGDHPRALVLMSQGRGAAEPGGGKLPFGVRLFVAKGFLRTPIGRRFGALLPTLPPEMREIRAHTGPASDYAGVTAEVLLATGANSPPYFAAICDALAHEIGKSRTIVVPRSAHNAPTIARKGFATPFADFFTTPDAPSSRRG